MLYQSNGAAKLPARRFPPPWSVEEQSKNLYSKANASRSGFLRDNAMGDFIGLCAIVIVALSPLLRRFYIDRFWVHARGTVIRMEVISYNLEEGAWVWTPIIEYQTAGQQFSSRVFPFRHRLNAKSKYSVGDEVDILYEAGFSPSSWTGFIMGDDTPDALT